MNVHIVPSDIESICVPCVDSVELFYPSRWVRKWPRHFGLDLAGSDIRMVDVNIVGFQICCPVCSLLQADVGNLQAICCVFVSVTHVKHAGLGPASSVPQFQNGK